MYVPFGAPGDVCQARNRQPGAPGQNPCEELARHGGIWQFDAEREGQTERDGRRYATGIRSIVAMTWNREVGALYALQHGRDDLYRSWSGLYSKWQSAVLPSEEFFKVEDGMDGGWPYYYYDWMQETKPLNPGAFIAFHGSTIRMPYSQAGYFVAFVPFSDGAPSGPWEVFADGFAGVDPIVNTSDAAARPMGLAQGPDGSLYISDSVKGKIWRVTFQGDRDAFGAAQLASMEARKTSQAHIRQPDERKDALGRNVVEAGAKLYDTYCVECHQRDGRGDGMRFPPIVATDWVYGDAGRLVSIILNGISGEIEVGGNAYNGVMPGHRFLTDDEVSELVTFLRRNFGNHAAPVPPVEVADIRARP